MEKTKALCIFPTLLGGKAATAAIIKALDKVRDLEATYVLIDKVDYETLRPPWWIPPTNFCQIRYIARKKAAKFLDQKFDLLFVRSWELVVAFSDIARRVPAAASFDATPATLEAELRNRRFKMWKRALSWTFHHQAFARAVRQFDFFLPKGSDCAYSLERDYKIPRGRCFVTLSAQSTDSWIPIPRTYTPPARLLFVGNDFVRKGGDFLLRLFANHLADKCSLTIVSNDPVVGNRHLAPGVTWLRGKNREQLLDVYRQSDILLFPTQQDFVPEVLAEALTMGLPCLVNDLRGLRDLVKDGETGFVFPRNAPAEVWADRIQRLLADRSELARMSASARRFAEGMLNEVRFNDLIAQAIDRLRSGNAKRIAPRDFKSRGTNEGYMALPSGDSLEHPVAGQCPSVKPLLGHFRF
jgi:glycosyltransferase involved in cell wall biosynthesis